MTTVVIRAVKGVALTYNEMDANFINLNTDKLETTSIGTTVQRYSANLDSFATVSPTAAGLTLLDDVDATAQRATLGAQKTLVSGSNIKTINGTSLLGSGDVAVSVADGDKGDITVSASGTVWSVDDNTITPSKLTQKPTLGTSVATTSGTAIDFTGIPSWVKRITVSLSGVSTNGASLVQVQLGAGTIQTTSYAGAAGFYPTATGALFTTGIGLEAVGSASQVRHGSVVLVSMGSNMWGCTVNIGYSHAAVVSQGGGSVTLTGVLDRIRLTTVNGTDLFDAGSVNVMYEG